jgi:integrase/recombinase XerD
MPDRPKAPKHTYWRGDTLWSRFTVAGDEFRESLRTGSPKVAARRVAEMRAKQIGRAKFGEEAHLWDDTVVAWSVHIRRQVGSARTVKRYADSLAIAGRHFSTIAIADIDKAMINKFVTSRQRDGVTNATIRRDLQAVSSLLDFADDQGWRDGNPALDKMRRLKEHRDPIQLPDEADYEFVLSRLAVGHAEFLRAARATGMRQDELARAERKHFNAANSSLLVVGKGNKQQTIKLSPEAVAIIARQPAALGCTRIFHHAGKPITQAAFVFSRARRAAQQAAQKAGVDFRGFRFHDMRHLYAVEYLRGGGDVYDLKDHLRHSSVKTTEIYLAFLTPEEAERAKHGAGRRLDQTLGLSDERSPSTAGG